MKYANVLLRKRICVCVNSSQSLTAVGSSLLTSDSSKLLNFNKLKNILGSSASLPRSTTKKSSPSTKKPASNLARTMSTSVTYRLVSVIPRLLTEIENREILADKAALMVVTQEKEELTSLSKENSCDDLNSNTNGLNKLSLNNPVSYFEQYAKTIEAVDSILKADRLQQQLTVKKLIQNELNKIHGSMTAEEKSILVEPEEKFAENVADISPPKIEIPKEKNTASDSQKIFEMYESIKKNEEQTAKKCEEDDAENLSRIERLIFESTEPSKEQIITNNSMLSVDEKKSPDKQQLRVDETDELMNRATSSLSIASTLTNSSQTKLGSIKSETDEQVPDWVSEGVCVIVTTNTVMNKRGHVRYIGETKFGTGKWIGVELEQPAGKNDGSVKGTRYFKCPANKGVFVRPDKLTLVVDKTS